MSKSGISMYDDFEKVKANHVPLSPLSFLPRAASFYPDKEAVVYGNRHYTCLLYTSPSPRDGRISRMPSSA